MVSAAERQRKLTAKAARRKAIVTEKKKGELSSSSLVNRVRVASHGRIVRCMMPSTLYETGIGHVILARTLPTGVLGCAFFLVDVFCLGIKDVFYAEVGEDELRTRVEEQQDVQPLVDVDPCCARKLIRDAAAYAADLGLPAARDTPAIEPIFGDIDANVCRETFTFGKDGKPFFVSGPNDTPARIRMITKTLEATRGAGNWEYMIGLPSGLGIPFTDDE